MRHDLRGPGGRVERFQHVLADEAGEVTDGLHGHGLVEQLQGLLGFDAEPAPEIPAVLGETVVHTGTGRAQPFLQRSDLRAEVGEIRGDGQVPLRDDEEPLRLALMTVLQPEHLSQGYRRLVARVGENAEDYREGGLISQRYRARGARGVAPLAL